VARAGLLGLLKEMLCENLEFGNKVSVRLDLASLPLIRGTQDCLSLGVESKQTVKLVADFQQRVAVKPAKKVWKQFPLLFDPQIAGGLLFTIAQHESLALLEALHNHGDTNATVIGHVEDFQESQIFFD
jgi:selenide,water dikinase